MAPMRRGAALLLRAVYAELLEVGPKILDLFRVAHAREGHAGAGDLLHGTSDVFLEHGFAPGDPRAFHCIRVVIALEGAGVAAVDAVEPRPEPDLRLGPCLRAGEGPLAECRVFLRQHASGRRNHNQRSQHPSLHPDLLSDPPERRGSLRARPLRLSGTRQRRRAFRQVFEWRLARNLSTPRAEEFAAPRPNS